ncbi:Calcineurin B homologous protein 1-like [Oopsacas minuta]|uniref:Calcineurin B homologous protein 1-like n=1 Tax=Oopsacas minuta TaxID=111878 RepID=A0AAV7JUQ9_9METZ|nr:Calcineurin B homologous protein 1-like [Oopsacas minuta]
MGNSPSILTTENLDELHKETGFTHHQIKRLHRRFNALDKEDKGYLQMKDLQLIPELALNPLGTRIIQSFFELKGGPQCDSINFHQFVLTLACFQSAKKSKTEDRTNITDAKIDFIFKCYDVSNSDQITKSDLVHVLTCMVGQHVSMEQTVAIAEKTLREGDKAGNGKISNAEFREALTDIDLEEKMTIRFLA